MTTKLQAEILCICFLHQTGLYPTEADHEIAIGHDYRLAWNATKVEDLDPDRASKLQQALDGLKQIKKQPVKKTVFRQDKLQKLVSAWAATGVKPYGNYMEVKYQTIGGMTAKGVFLDDAFAPFSQMKIDSENRVLIKNWLYEKAFRK